MGCGTACWWSSSGGGPCVCVNGLGHQSRECPETDFCRGCRLFGHLLAECPRSVRSYANTVAGRSVPSDDVGEEDMVVARAEDAVRVGVSLEAAPVAVPMPVSVPAPVPVMVCVPVPGVGDNPVRESGAPIALAPSCPSGDSAGLVGKVGPVAGVAWEVGAEVVPEVVVVEAGEVSVGPSGAGSEVTPAPVLTRSPPRQRGSGKKGSMLLPLGPLFQEVEVVGVQGQVRAFKRPHAPPEPSSVWQGPARGESLLPTRARRGTRSPRLRAGSGVGSSTQ